MVLRSLWSGFLVAVFLAGALMLAPPASAKGEAVAVFAGGCFWCVESDFDNVTGVKKTISGYTGGILKDPTYQQVTAGGTGHIEAVEIHYDPQVVSYEKLLDVFWHSVDPTDAGGQFCDRGASYATAIFAKSPEQKKLAEKSKAALVKSGILNKPIVTPIVTASVFYPAEGYHQDYYKKNPIRYRFYRTSCGRDRRVKALWGKDAHRGISKH
jgi:peptide-methionine (S)-S-oxide reductase